MRNARRTAAILALALLAALFVPGIARAVAPAGIADLTSPANGETVLGNPVLRWTAVTGAVKYRVQVSASAAFTTLLYNVDTGGLGATPTSDLPLGTIYWRVAATDGSAGVGPFSSSSFVRQPATQPQLLGPVDGAALAYPATTPVLRWSPVPGVKNYRVELAESPDFPTPTVSTTANTALALTAPLILGTHYWRVQGVSATAGVTTEYSPTWTFVTTWPAQSGAPVLTSPIGGVFDDVTDLVFRWRPVPGAHSYLIQVNSNPDFTNNMAEDRVVVGTQFSPAATYDNATYYWRVRALDTGSPVQHYGPWSEVGSFLRSWLAQPEPVSPLIGESQATQRFEWTPVAHATYYTFEVSTDPNFSTVTRCTSYATSLTGTTRESLSQPLTDPPTSGTCALSLTPGNRFYWHVRGVDQPAGVDGVWSATTDFLYMADSTPTVLGPTDGASLSAPVLSWAPLERYGRYRVVVTTPSGTVTVDTYSTSYGLTKDLKVGDLCTWSVAGLNGDGKVGVMSEEHSFTIAAATAETTGSLAADNTMQPFAMPSMTWNAMAGAAYYNIYAGLAVTHLYDATPLNGSTKDYHAAFTHSAGVLAPGDYQWKVRGYTKLGATVGEWTGGTFTIVDMGFTSYTSPPNCVLPDCVAERPNTPELSWQPVAGTWRYEVYVALDKDFTNGVYQYWTTETALTPRESYLDNAAGQSYFWFVRPCKAPGRCGEYGGGSLLALEQAFRKKSAPAVLVSPADGAQVGDGVVLEWQDYRTSAPDGVGARQYRVQVATDPGFQAIVDDATVDQTAYEAWKSAYPDGAYYWRVQALDGEGAGLTRSAVRQFTKTSAVPVPEPVDPQALGLPTMRWAAMPYASAYGVEVYTGTSPAFPSGSRVLNTTTKLPAYAPTGTLAAGWYSWRVRKIDPSGNVGPWSATLATFQVRQLEPQLLAPVDGASLATNDLLFTWQALTGAAAYRFESSTSNGFGTTLEKVTTVMTAWAPAALYADATSYFWRVSVLDGDGHVMATSATRTLVKDSGHPAMTGATPATKLAADGTITVTFSEPVRGVSGSTLTLTPATGSTTPVPTVLTPAPDVASATVTITPRSPLIPGQFYDVTATPGLTDASGNAVQPDVKRVRVAQALDNTSPALVERWDLDGNTKADGSGYMTSRQAGSSATFSFTGAGPVTVVGRTFAAGGNADLLVDGVKKATVSFYSKAETFRKTMFGTTVAGAGAHTLTVRVLGTKPTGSSGSSVDLDAFTFGGATYQESSSAVATAFARQTSASALGGSYDTTTGESDPSGAEYRFSFRGTGLTWQATKLPNGGTAKVYVDGALRSTASLYSRTAAFKAAVYNSATFDDAVHDVRIVLTGVLPTGSAGAYVTLDSVTLR